MALIFGLSFPALILIVVVAIELRALTADQSRLQELADAAALNTAAQMRMGANDQLLRRSRAALVEQTGELAAKLEAADLSFVQSREGRAGVKVDLTARRTSFFGNLLPPGGFVIKAQATAEQLGVTPLCVLMLSRSSSNALHVQDGDIVARACLAHSNKDIQLGAKGFIDAAAVQASGGIKGRSVANAGTSAPPVADPLTHMFPAGPPPLCTNLLKVQVDAADQTASVLPGVHCRHFDIEKGTLRLLPGVHHLRAGELQLKKGAKIVGTNVALVIWKDAKVTFSDGRVDRLDLTGVQGGWGELAHWAGFVLAVDPARTDDLTLNFNDIRRLEGVVYAPGTRLIVPAGLNSNDATPWTVVVAREMRIEGGRRLAINADYAASSVPVPNGVGDQTAGGGPTRLTD